MVSSPFNILVIEPGDADARELSSLLDSCAPLDARGESGPESRAMDVAVRVVGSVPAALAAFDCIRPHLLVFGPHAGAAPEPRSVHQLRARAGMEPVPVLAVLDEHALPADGVGAGCDDVLRRPYNRHLVRLKLVALRRYCQFNRNLIAQCNRMRRSQSDLLKEQAGAQEIFRNMGRESCLEQTDAIRYHLSPRAVLNGDVLAAAWAPGGKLMLLLGDFTGHGLAAAVGAVPLTSIFYSMVPKGFTLSQIARELNLKLHLVLPRSMFCCAVLLELDPHKQHLRVLNAGMPSACLCRAGGSIQMLESRHLPLGVVRWLNLEEAVHYVPLEPGDWLYLWSDGIHEARGPSGELFGEERLLATIRNAFPAARFERILAEISRFSVGQQDDLSLVELSLDQITAETVEIGEPLPDPPGTGHFGDWSFGVTLAAEDLRQMDPVPLMHRVLAQFPESGRLRDTLSIVLGELFNNAIEHGLLQLDSSLKRSEHGFGEYYRRLESGRRQLQDGWIRIRLSSCRAGGDCGLLVSVSDSGPGLPARTGAANAYSGRGLALLQSICRRVEWQPGASEVRALLSWEQEENSPWEREGAPAKV